MKLGEIAKIQTGKLDVNAGNPAGKYLFFTCAKEPTRIDAYSFDCECVLVAGNGDLNVKYYNGKFEAYQRTYVIEVINKKIFSTRFIYYCLQKYLEKLRNLSIGGVIKYIKLNNLTDIVLPKYTFKEQLNIVELLDKADTLRKNRQESIKLLDDFLKATFYEMFGDPKSKKWPEVQFSELAAKKKNSMRTGPFGSTLLHSEFVEKGIAVLGIDNAVENRFAWDQRRFITEEKYRKLKNYTVFPGDVLVTIMGTLGRSSVVPDDIPLAINTKHLACITLDRAIANPYYVSYSIYSDPIILEQLNRLKKGAIMDGLNITIMKNLKIYLPPLKVQDEFVNIKHQAEKIKLKASNSLNSLDNQFNALMQRYFE